MLKGRPDPLGSQRSFLNDVEPDQTHFLHFASVGDRIENHRINQIISALGGRQFLLFDYFPSGFYGHRVIGKMSFWPAANRNPAIELLFADKVEFNLVETHFKTDVGVILSDQRATKSPAAGLVEVSQT